MRSSVGFFLIIFMTQILFAQENIRIENGDIVSAKNNLSRSVALVKFATNTFCSASFITSKVLITAGHCTFKKTASTSTVNIKSSQGKWFSLKAAKFKTHPSYSINNAGITKVKNDIGLIYLNEEFPVKVYPLKIAGANYLVDNIELVTVAGYGWRAANMGGGFLRQGKMAATVKPIVNFYDRLGIFMTEEYDQAVCPGDSGGAVLSGGPNSYKLIGVNSLSSGCQGDFAAMSMSEIASSHIKWIKQNVSL